jgi:hypothetical protein
LNVCTYLNICTRCTYVMYVLMQSFTFTFF